MVVDPQNWPESADDNYEFLPFFMSQKATGNAFILSYWDPLSHLKLQRNNMTILNMDIDDTFDICRLYCGFRCSVSGTTKIALSCCQDGRHSISAKLFLNHCNLSTST